MMYKGLINFSFLAVVRYNIYVICNVDVLNNIYQPLSLFYFLVSAVHIVFINYITNINRNESINILKLFYLVLQLMLYMLAVKHVVNGFCYIVSPLLILDALIRGSLRELIYNYLDEYKMLMGTLGFNTEQPVVKAEVSIVLFMNTDDTAGTSESAGGKAGSTNKVSESIGESEDPHRSIPPVHGPDKLMDVSLKANIPCVMGCKCKGIITEDDNNTQVNRHVKWMWQNFLNLGDQGLTSNSFWWTSLRDEAQKSNSKILRGLLENKVKLGEFPDHPSTLNGFFNKLQILQRDGHMTPSQARPIRDTLLRACNIYNWRINK